VAGRYLNQDINMDKNFTQKGLNSLIKKLEREYKDSWRCTDPEYQRLQEEAKKIKDEWNKKMDSRRNEINDELRLAKSDLKEIKGQRELKIPEEISKWWRSYKNAMDWGYGGLKIRWISDDNLFVIITNPGSTAGTGTAMGTGGYYYSNSNHWLARTDQPYSGLDRKFNHFYEIQGGRLTKSRKEYLIRMSEAIRMGEPTEMYANPVESGDMTEEQYVNHLLTK